MDGSGTADRVDRAAVFTDVSTAGATDTRVVDPLTVTQRLQREGRWAGRIELERDDMMRLAKDRFATKEERQQWVYGELDRMYPPKEAEDNRTMSYQPDQPGLPDGTDDNRTMSYSERANRSEDGQIQGLGEIPAEWPELPSNAGLATEIGWVQANRLRIVEERPGRATLVHLGRSLSPAPSWAALGWLETSIRSYAKFVDVAAKVSGSDNGEAAWMKHERMAIEEMEGLINEMMEDRATKLVEARARQIEAERRSTT